MNRPRLVFDTLFPDATTPHYRNANVNIQYDAATGNSLNCSYPQVGPMEIAVKQKYLAGSTPTLQDYTALALGACKGSNLDPQGLDDLNNFISIEYAILKELYVTYTPTGQNSEVMVPIYEGIGVNCPGGITDVTLIPYVLEYTLDRDYTRFARFCMSATNAEKLSFTNITDYKLFDYIDASTQAPCASSSCNTTLAPFLGFNLNPEPSKTVRRTKIETSEKTLTYILMAVAGVLGIILIGIIIAYAMKVDSDKLNNKFKNAKAGKTTTYNPVYSTAS